MKLINMLILLLLIQTTIAFYYQLYESDSTTDYLISTYGENDTKIWDFVKDPTGWNASPLIIALLGLGGIASAFIAIGVFTSTPSDTVIFAPIFVVLIGAGLIPIISLYQVITSEPTLFGCTGIPCTPAIFVWIFTGGLIGLMYIASVLEWWSGRSLG